MPVSQWLGWAAVWLSGCLICTISEDIAKPIQSLAPVVALPNRNGSGSGSSTIARYYSLLHVYFCFFCFFSSLFLVLVFGRILFFCSHPSNLLLTMYLYLLAYKHNKPMCR
jgi:hypothetical protein